jgi:hypothetical protein
MNPAILLPLRTGLRPDSPAPEKLTLGHAALDNLTGGFPRGTISEIAGPESSGRVTLVHALLAASTQKREICAYVDASDSFDPCSASAAGVALAQLLWVRCGHHAERAFKTADALLHAGGFGVIVLDLCRVPDGVARRIPLSYWYRFRRAVENTPTILAVLERDPLAKSCASLILDLKRKQAVWSGASGFHLLRAMDIEIACRKPARSQVAALRAAALSS